MDKEKQDPLNDQVYKPLLCAEAVQRALFYLSAALSILSLITHDGHGFLFSILQPLFLTSSLLYFALGLLIKLHFFPRAQIRRYRDFLGHATGKQADHKETIGYYNNSSAAGPSKVAAQVLESAFFTKEILTRMLPFERAIAGVYFILWLLAVYYRSTDLEWIGILAQILFSEEVLSRWLRLEWLKWNTEQIYEELSNILRNKAKVDLLAWVTLGKYEIGKATAASSLSPKVFKRWNDALNKEWNQIRESLGV
jgi:hypothetical protein